jgi:hypothetical protein
MLRPPSRQGLAQLRALRVRQEGRAQLLQRHLHAVAQVLPHAPALVEALLVVLFEPARVRVGAAAWEARVVHEAVEQHELAVQVPLDHRLQVEL